MLGRFYNICVFEKGAAICDFFFQGGTKMKLKYCLKKKSLIKKEKKEN